jgi:hypothetical protein
MGDVVVSEAVPGEAPGGGDDPACADSICAAVIALIRASERNRFNGGYLISELLTAAPGFTAPGRKHFDWMRTAPAA